MKKIGFALLTALVTAATGCPTANYMVADVTNDNRPIRDALVAADCGKNLTSARRTGEDGRAFVELDEKARAGRCVVTVAKPGYRTLETRRVNLCSQPEGCPETRFVLTPSGAVR